MAERERSHPPPLITAAVTPAHRRVLTASDHCRLCSSCSYNILLSERGVAAMEAAGADVSGFDIPDLGVGLRHKCAAAPPAAPPPWDSMGAAALLPWPRSPVTVSGACACRA